MCLVRAGAGAADQFATGQAATRVYGQFDFTSTFPGQEAFQMGTVSGLALVDNRLIVSDGGFLFTTPSNNRLLIFHNFSALRPGMGADVVVGQANFGVSCGSDGKQACTSSGAGAASVNQPLGVATDGQRLVVADAGNNRVLIFNRIPTTNGAAADVVLGQASFTVTAPGTSPTALRVPNGVFLSGGRLFIADTQNHRVLIYNTIPTSNSARPDVVLGQTDFNTRNQASASQTAMLDPVTVTSDGVRLFITDLGFNRVLIYNRIPTANGAPADVVVGQPDFTSSASGKGAAALDFPRYALSDGTRLYIADSGNNRVLVYNQIPQQNGAAADVVLGQLDSDIVSEGASAERLDLPTALAFSPSGLLVADSNNRRVVEFTPGAPLVPHGGITNVADFGGNGMVRPSNVTAQAQDGGKIPAGRYYIKVTAISGFPRESTPSEEIAVDVPGGSKISVNWSAISGATSYRVYVGPWPGLENRYYTTGLNFATAPPIVFGGTPTVGDTAAITITKSDATTFNFVYTVKEGDGLGQVANAMAAGVNSNTSNDTHGVTAASDGINTITLKPKELGAAGGNLKYQATTTGNLTVSPNTSTQFTPPSTGPPEPAVIFDDLTAAPSLEISLTYDTPSNRVVPGSIVALFGADLAPATAQAPGVPLPTELAGTSVLVNEGPAPLFFVSPSQINFQVPMELTGTSVSVRVRKQTTGGTVYSVAVPAALTIPEPAVFSRNGTGIGTALALHADGTLITTDSPAQLNEVIVLYGTGFGLLADTPGNVQTTFADTGGNITPGTYFMRVTTIFPDGTESLGHGENQISSATGNTTKISITWDAVPGAASYRVYVGLRERGYDRYFETGTNSFDLVSLAGTPGRPPIQTNVPGDGKIHVATTGVAILQGHDMPINFNGVAPGFVGLFQLNARVPDDLAFDAAVAVGTLSVTREGLVTWNTRNVVSARVSVKADGGDEQTFAEGPSGSLQADFVAQGHIYAWTLRDVSGGDPGVVLATFTLDLRGAGSLNPSAKGRIFGQGIQELASAEVRLVIGAIESNHLLLPVRVPFIYGRISVTTAGLVTWQTVGVTLARVLVHTDDGTDQVFSEDLNGSLQADFVTRGHVYFWRLLDVSGGDPGKILATFTLDLRPSGSISVTPQGLVTWSTVNVTDAKVFVSADGGDPVLFTQGPSGSVQADFVLPGHVYVWTLRDISDGDPGTVLATFTLDLR